MALIRRLIRGIADTLAMGGLARMGSGYEARTGHVIQTRFVADSVLPMVREEEKQHERTRALWSLVGALLLAGLGLPTLAAGWALGNALALILGAVQLVLAGAVVAVVRRRATRGSLVHLAGAATAAISIYASILAPPPLFGEAALVGLLLAIGAALALVVGRR